MISKMLREPVSRLLTPIGKGIAATGISPNGLTIVGFLITSVGCYLVAGGELFIAGFVITFGGVFDALDGLVAKVSGKSSKRGAFLDSTLDRLSDAFLFSAAAVYLMGAGVPFLDTNSVRSGFYLYEVFLPIACLITAFMTSYIRARAESLGFDGSAGFMERAERVIIYLVGLFLGLLVEALAILLLLSAITVVQRFVSVWRQGRTTK